jgi:hypothetical protein
MRLLAGLSFKRLQASGVDEEEGADSGFPREPHALGLVRRDDTRPALVADGDWLEITTSGSAHHQHRV